MILVLARLSRGDDASKKKSIKKLALWRFFYRTCTCTTYRYLPSDFLVSKTACHSINTYGGIAIVLVLILSPSSSSYHIEVTFTLCLCLCLSVSVSLSLSLCLCLSVCFCITFDCCVVGTLILILLHPLLVRSLTWCKLVGVVFLSHCYLLALSIWAQ
jgi:hypothetical protein